MKHGKCDKHGFTLIELILVSIVLAVLIAVAVPGFSKTSRRFQSEQTAFHLAQFLRYARGLAVIEQATIAAAWDEDSRRIYLERLLESDWVRISGSRTRSDAVSSGITVSLMLEDRPAERVRFFPDGTSERAALFLSHQDYLYTVAIHATTGQASLTTETQPL